MDDEYTYLFIILLLFPNSKFKGFCVTLLSKNKITLRTRYDFFYSVKPFHLYRPENVSQLTMLTFIDFLTLGLFFSFQLVCTFESLLGVRVLKQNIPCPVCSNALQLTSVPFNLYWGTHPPHVCFWNLEKKFYLLDFLCL